MLTKRWTPLVPHPVQTALWNTKVRFPVVPAGRRSGKTERAKRKLAMSGLTWRGDWHANYFAGAPTWEQAKRIYWEDLKALIPSYMILGKPNESELRINLKTDASIHVVGLDRPERIEGSPWDGGILDEYGNMKAGVWDKHVRPAMSDRNGWCWFIGVPEGRNHYYDLAEKARVDQTGTYGLFSWFSKDILPPAEIEQAMRDLDPLTFAQEYEAAFIVFQGQTYYAFNRDVHVAPVSYDQRAPLHFCFDFNIAPGVASVIQERDGTSCIIDEVHIPRGSNTPKVCERLIAKYEKHPDFVYLYGDASGGARGTAKIGGSDWDLISQAFRPIFGPRLHVRVPRANPPERARVATVNSRLRNAAGEARILVNPSCRETIKDFEGVVSADDGSIDKNKTPELTHMSDAIGYYLCERFPLVKGVISNHGIQ